MHSGCKFITSIEFNSLKSGSFSGLADAYGTGATT